MNRTVGRRLIITIFALCGCLLLAACSRSVEPENETRVVEVKTDLRIAALDYAVGDLSDPEELARYTRADLLIVQCDRFWGQNFYEGQLNIIRAAKPDIKIIGYFRSKVIKTKWGEYPREAQTYNYDLYQAAKPYWSSTTTGDTLMDWPGAVVFDYTNPAARKAMLDVFVHYQNTSTNKFDGVFWDYFNERLWIAPAVTGMDGEPDMDGDGIAQWDDVDEIAAFKDAQYDWVREMQRAMGPEFIQIANGSRALIDSTFAGQFDGMYYELFPNVGFGRGDTFRQAMDPSVYNNLWAAHNWPRTVNGGPWLLLAHAPRVGSYQLPDGSWEAINAGDLLRAVALLTGATSVHFDNSGKHHAGIPGIEFDLGAPLGAVNIDGDSYSRVFERGRVDLEMGTGSYPAPFSYVVPENGVVVEQFGEMPNSP